TKSTDTTFRSSAGSACSTSGAPHARQKRARSGFSSLQAEQMSAMGFKCGGLGRRHKSHRGHEAVEFRLRERARIQLDDECRRTGEGVVLPGHDAPGKSLQALERQADQAREAPFEVQVASRLVHEPVWLVKPDRDDWT